MAVEHVPFEYERIADMMDEYFMQLRAYNRMLGAFDMRPDEILDARRREALSYSKVLAAKRKLAEMGIPL